MIELNTSQLQTIIHHYIRQNTIQTHKKTPNNIYNHIKPKLSQYHKIKHNKTNTRDQYTNKMAKLDSGHAFKLKVFTRAKETPHEDTG